jgi:nitrogen regulatory protein PII
LPVTDVALIFSALITRWTCRNDPSLMSEPNQRECSVDFLAKVKFKIVIPDDQLQKTIQAIVAAARTGKFGDGKVFVVKIEKAIRIRTQERDAAAV